MSQPSSCTKWLWNTTMAYAPRHGSPARMRTPVLTNTCQMPHCIDSSMGPELQHFPSAKYGSPTVSQRTWYCDRNALWRCLFLHFPSSGRHFYRRKDVPMCVRERQLSHGAGDRPCCCRLSINFNCNSFHGQRFHQICLHSHHLYQGHNYEAHICRQ